MAGDRGARKRAWVGLLLAGVAGPTLAGQALGQSTTEVAGTTPLILDPIVVEGDPGVVTEGSESYAADRATVGFKQPVDVREVPQAVTVITRQRLDDGGATSLEDAGYLVPNLSTATGNGFDGSLYSRGHEVFTYNVDGAPRPFLSLYGTAPDLVFFDRVEVLSGPSGVFQGSGEPVGTINLVRKRPGNTLSYGAAASIGSVDSYRAEADVGGPLTESGSVRGRGIGYAETEGSFMDYAERDRGGGYATLEFDVSDFTTISAGAIAESQETTSTSGMPTFADGSLINLSRSTFIGAPWNQRDIDTAEGFAEVEHEFGFGGVLKVSGRVYDRSTVIRNALASSAVDAATGDFDMFTFARDYDETTSYGDVNLTTPFRFRGRKSEFTIGADYRRSEQDMKQNFDFSLGTQNIYTFDPGSLDEPDITFSGVGPGFRLNTETESNEFGGYAYSRLQVYDGLHLTFGARYATYDSETEDTGRGTTTTVEETRLVPMAGISYDISSALTLYASYSEIFQPQSEQAADGSQLDPVIGRQAEVGTKVSLFDGALSGHASVFWLQDENRAEDDPNNVGSSIAAGEEETKGLELYLAGSPYPGLQLTAGYAYVDTGLDDDPTPPHSAVAWAKYTFLEGPLENFYVGAGLQAVSGFESSGSGIDVKAPGHTVFNGLVGYSFMENFDARLQVNNILDRTYYDRVNDTTRGTFYGEPLNATLKISAKF